MKKVAIPPMVSGIIMNGILSLDGYLFDKADRCPSCGGELKAHDIKKKRFATIISEGSRRNITVNVKRFRCTKCKKLVYAESPFYEKIRMGAPIADFCVLNLKIHPANHISRVLRKMSIIVNPGTIRNLSGLDTEDKPSIDFHDIRYPLSLLNISEAVMNKEGAERDNILLYMLQKKH